MYYRIARSQSYREPKGWGRVHSHATVPQGRSNDLIELSVLAFCKNLKIQTLYHDDILADLLEDLCDDLLIGQNLKV